MIKVAIIEDNAGYRQTLSIILQLDESLQLLHKLPNCNDMLMRFTEACPREIKITKAIGEVKLAMITGKLD